MRLRGGAYQLGGDPHLVPGPAYASFHQRPGPELPPDLRGFLLLLLVAHHRSPGYDFQLSHPAESVDQFLRQPIRKELVLRVRAHVDDRKDSDPAGFQFLPRTGLVLPGHDYPVRLDWHSDVLQLLLAEAEHLKLEFIGHLVVDLPAQAHPAVTGERLDSRSEVDRIPRNVSLRLYH